MIEIVPSVLAHTKPAFRNRLTLAAQLSRRIHIDVMDGKLVPTRSVGLETLRRQTWPGHVELHLMVERPEDWLEAILPRAVDEVVVHVEIGHRLRYALAMLRSNRKKVSLAINPRTPLVRLWPWLKFVQGAHVMTVNPGRLHALFFSSMIKRVEAIHARYPRLRITCDGGVTPKTIQPLVEAGTRRVIVGSYLQSASDPTQALERLQAAVG